MESILVEGDSVSAVKYVKDHIGEYGRLNHVAVYFDNNNFLFSDYEIKSGLVHLVLDCEKIQLQVESANCGYIGSGSNATIEILEAFGLLRKDVELMITDHSALDFYVDADGNIMYEDTFEMFCADIGAEERRRFDVDKIHKSNNVQIDIKRRKGFFYNPQRHCFIGFLRMLKHKGNLTMKYYIGENSPLENGIFLEGIFDDQDPSDPYAVDAKGVHHVNMVFYSDYATIVCLIDRQEEKQIIDYVYYVLTGKHLIDQRFIDPFAPGARVLVNLGWLIRHRHDELVGSIEITE